MSRISDRIRIVLCRPEGSRNVGACCRAMKTMSLEDLVIVGTGEALDTRQVSTSALHASAVFENARFVDSLDEALAGSVFSAGVTRRRGARRKYYSLLPEELAERAAQTAGTVAVVFGNERTGLRDDELAGCTVAVHIPSSPGFPSLNLSHALQVVAYVLYRQAEAAERFRPVGRERIETVVSTISQALKEMGYFRLTDGSHTEQLFREVFARAGLEEREALRITKLFRTLPHLHEDEGEAAE